MISFSSLKSTGSSALCSSYISVLDLLHGARCNTAVTHPVLAPSQLGRVPGPGKGAQSSFAVPPFGGASCLVVFKSEVCFYSRVLHVASSLGLSLSTECFVPQKSQGSSSVGGVAHPLHPLLLSLHAS